MIYIHIELGDEKENEWTHLPKQHTMHSQWTTKHITELIAKAIGTSAWLGNSVSNANSSIIE